MSTTIEKAAAPPKRSFQDMPLVWFGPAIFILLAVTLYPLAYVVWMSFQSTRYYDLTGFIGFANYANVFKSRAFRESCGTSAIYVLGSLMLSVPLGVAAAVTFNELGRFAAAFRVITLLPWTLSMGVVASLWLWLLNPSYGPISFAIRSLGGDAGLLLGDPDLALWLLIVVTGWWSFPYVMVIVTAALQSIPAELYEAADIDGAGAIAKFRNITWPHLLPTLASAALNLAILYLTIVTLILVLTGGGPLGATSTWSFQVFQATVQTVSISPAAVYSIVVLLANLLLGFFYVRITGKQQG